MKSKDTGKVVASVACMICVVVIMLTGKPLPDTSFQILVLVCFLNLMD